jgi:putative endopeptidase
MPALIAHLGNRRRRDHFDFGIHQDNKDSTKYVADIARAAWACRTATTT